MAKVVKRRASKTARTTVRAKSAKASKSKASKAKKSKISKPSVGPVTALDFVKFAAARLKKARVAFAHGTTDAFSESAFMVGEILRRHPDEFEDFAKKKVTKAEAARILDLVERRIKTRKPAAYLLNKMYMRGVPFYVDERTIVPRSFIGEILDEHFGGEGSLIGDPDSVSRVLDLCTGSGCLAILAARAFPNAIIDAVDLSKDAIEVARRNVTEHGLAERINLFSGDLFAPLNGKTYDLIISNPPYVDAQGMASLPPECREEPSMAFDGGADGLNIVRRIVDESAVHLNEAGGLLCEVGRCGPDLEQAFPRLPFLWLDTEDSEGEVFWIGAADL